jgi:hypothetical protein
MAISTTAFTKTVTQLEAVDINKAINVEAFALFNSALSNATADALGPWTSTETLTQTTAVQGVGSSSGAESLSVANPVDFSFVVPGEV